MSISLPSFLFSSARHGVQAFLVAMVVGMSAMVAAPSAAAQKPLPAGTAAFASRSAAKTPRAGNDLDAVIADLQLKITDLRSHPLPAGIELVAGLPNGATEQEYQEWHHLTDGILEELDSRIQAVQTLRNIRLLTLDLEVQSKGWRGFPTPPPYPLSLMDSLRDKIKARKISITNHEATFRTIEKELTGCTSLLRESGAERRLAEERLGRERGKSGETRLRWLLALAARRNELNETKVMTGEAWRYSTQEALKFLRQDNVFLEQKFSLAATNVRFTREELEQKLRQLDARRDRIAPEQARAVKAKKVEFAALDKISESLHRAMTETPATDTSSQEALKQSLEVQQFRVLLATTREGVFNSLPRLIELERRVWQARYRLASSGKGIDPPDFKEIQKDLEGLQGAKTSLRSNMDEVAGYIHSQEARLSAPDLSTAERETARELIAVLQEAKAFFAWTEDQLFGPEQLIQSFRAEVAAHSRRNSPVSGSIRDVLTEVRLFSARIWNTELYIAEDPVLIDGRKIIQARSVTIGKVTQAFLIFFIGIFAARSVRGPVRRLAARKFRLSENDARVFGRLTFYIIFICILLFSLIFVNIPLAVFTFLGGALAIGLGFGGQTLINNFISGLILLFDRTIRINDLVVVDGHRGRVTAIRIRSSQIRREDGVEMLIPNSHFLQQNVVNLTLSDPHTRYEITVGVAYGTSTRVAQALIHRAVVAQPEVLANPAPYVVFEEFADSSLNFRAFFWITNDPKVSDNIIRSDIRHRIGDYLAEAGIGVPYPQQDIHLNTTQPLEVTICAASRDGCTP